MRRTVHLLVFLGLTLCHAASVHAASAVQYFQGPGGLEVYFVESHANPMVEIRLLARGGSAFDPPEKAGVASLTAWMFNEGGGKMDATTFQERLTFHGISLGATASKDTLSVRLTTLTKQLDEAWSRLSDALLRPRFDEKDFARARAEQSAGIMKGREQPGVQASILLHQKLYPNHPYGHPVSGTLESLQRITTNDIRRFHQNAFHAPSTVLAVAGDMDLARLKALIHRHLSKLDATPSPFPPIPQAKEVTMGQQHLVMDVPQTALSLGTLGVNRHDPDYYAFYVLNQILGGSGLSSRLNEEIREKRGLAYGVYSYSSPLEGGGPFVVGMKTKTASANEALFLIYQEIQRMAKDGVSELELQEVKRYLSGSFPLYLDGLSKLSSIWSTIGFYKRGLDYLEKWPERIHAVTRKDVLRAARRILDLSQFYTVTAGKEAVQGKQK